MYRITVEEALKHPYMKLLHNETDEPRCDAVFDNKFEGEADASSEDLWVAMIEEADILQA